MSTFWGYVLEGTALLVLWLWWMGNTFVSAIKSQSENKPFITRLTYSFPGRRLPVETLYKLTVAGLGFLATFFYDGVLFTDSEGHFRKMATVISMSIYSIFLVHSVLELLLYYGVPLVRDANYAVASLGFMWYGMANFYRAHDFLSTNHVAVMVKTFPTYPLVGIGLCILIEMGYRNNFLAQMLRVLFTGIVATWNLNAARILHSASTFPGKGDSNWDMMNHDNVSFIGAAFGDHLCIHLAFIVLAYIVTAVIMKVRCGISVRYVECPGHGQ